MQVVSAICCPTKTGGQRWSFKRQLDIKYDTAWMLKHKLLQTSKVDDKRPSAASFSSMMSTGVESAVVANEVAARQGKTPFVAAVALNKEGHPTDIPHLI